MKRVMTLATAVSIGLLAYTTGLAQEVFKGEWTGEFDNKAARLSLKTMI